jgi:hypothetical protein
MIGSPLRPRLGGEQGEPSMPSYLAFRNDVPFVQVDENGFIIYIN